MDQYMLSYFKYDHLPERLQQISKPFHDLALQIDAMGGDRNEREHALRKLLEAKDCAVRSQV
jgi:hypothetical protein